MSDSMELWMKSMLYEIMEEVLHRKIFENFKLLNFLKII